MVNLRIRRVIFILIRKIAIPVVLVVAWIGTGLLASAMIKQNKEEQVQVMQELAMKQKEEAEKKAAEELKEENIQDEAAITRDQVTSRSGSRANREEAPAVYYEEVGVNVADDEIEILERIVQAEAGGSGYDGMLAVANVVLNRVKSDRFPNTVTDVVFANRQFTPISDGRYYTVKVSDTAKQVVEDALNGARLIGEDALYFCTPTANGKGWFERALRKIDYIAPHNFYGYKLEE